MLGLALIAVGALLLSLLLSFLLGGGLPSRSESLGRKSAAPPTYESVADAYATPQWAWYEPTSPATPGDLRPGHESPSR